MASVLGLLCRKSNGGSLCYKRGGSSLVYKSSAGEETTITFAWGVEVRDLDIAAYWDGDSGYVAGFGHNTSKTEHINGAYHIKYSGDETSADSSEWCKVRMSPWGSGGARTFRVHFNVYGFGDDYPGNTCTVIASQPNGQTLIKRNQTCSTRAGQRAETTDPSCLVTFNSKGMLESLT